MSQFSDCKLDGLMISNSDTLSREERRTDVKRRDESVMTQHRYAIHHSSKSVGKPIPK